MPKRKQKIEVPSPRDPNPSVEFLTVAWMLSVMTALVCELGFVAARGYLLLVDSKTATIQALAAMLLFAALVIGLVSLGLMVLVVRMRRVTPPRGILVFAAVVSLVPVAAMIVRLLSGSLIATP
ncbi:MAG TPA: hypothetical protein VGN12_11580 [Pirellulales bacterium]|jgi:hypothetical protein